MKKNKFASFLGIIWGLIIVVVMAITVSIFTDKHFPTELREFANCIVSQDYESVYVAYKRNEAIHYEMKNCKEYDMVGATAEYIEAAALYRVYSEKEDVRTNEYYEKMQQAKEKMCTLTYAADDIDKKLGITK